MKKDYKKERYKKFGDWWTNRGLGGSSISALFDCNPYLTKLDLYLSSINPKDTPPNTSTENTIYGQKAEPLIRNVVALNFEKNYKVHNPIGYEMYRCISKPYLVATIDGIMTDLETKEKWVLEIKTREITCKEDELEWEGHIPQRYFIQVLHYLGVLNDFVGAWVVAKLRWVDFDTGFVKKEEIRYYKLLRKDFEKDIAIVRKVAIDFQENHIAKRIPPSIDIPILRKEEN